MTNLLSHDRSTLEPKGLLFVAAVLMAVGVVMVASTNASIDDPLVSGGAWRSSFVRQGIFASVGLVVMGLTFRLASPLLLASPRLSRRLPPLFLAAVLLLLISVLSTMFSPAHRGSYRWLSLGPAWMGLGLQPSEFAKPALVMFLAWLLTRPGCDPQSFRKGFLPALCALAVVVALVGIEDFGTAALIAAVGGLTLLVAGCRIIHLVGAASLGGLGFVGLLLSQEYRMERLVAFMDPSADPLGAGYHARQSLMTIASGGWFGKGLGAGIQKYGYLPESSTDFIFSAICEEAGVVGGVMVAGLFLLMVALGVRTMLAAPTSFERLMAFGITATLGLQAGMNIAVATVVAPTTGISLPLVSAGGSGLMTYSLAIGLLAAIAGRGCRVEGEAAIDSTQSEPRVRFRTGEKVRW